MEIFAEKIGAFEILFLVIYFRKNCEIKRKLLFPVGFRYSCKFHIEKHGSFALYTQN